MLHFVLLLKSEGFRGSQDLQYGVLHPPVVSEAYILFTCHSIYAYSYTLSLKWQNRSGRTGSYSATLPLPTHPFARGSDHIFGTLIIILYCVCVCVCACMGVLKGGTIAPEQYFIGNRLNTLILAIKVGRGTPLSIPVPSNTNFFTW